MSSSAAQFPLRVQRRQARRGGCRHRGTFAPVWAGIMSHNDPNPSNLVFDGERLVGEGDKVMPA
jgi:hypothetical protein